MRVQFATAVTADGNQRHRRAGRVFRPMQRPRTHEQRVREFRERVYQVIGVTVGKETFAAGRASRA